MENRNRKFYPIYIHFCDLVTTKHFISFKYVSGCHILDFAHYKKMQIFAHNTESNDSLKCKYVESMEFTFIL